MPDMFVAYEENETEKKTNALTLNLFSYVIENRYVLMKCVEGHSCTAELLLLIETKEKKPHTSICYLFEDVVVSFTSNASISSIAPHFNQNHMERKAICMARHSQ